jgi:hypothetical protein
MVDLNLLDDRDIKLLLRTTSVKIIEYILTVMYAALMVVVIMNFNYNNLQIENIFEELIIIFILSLCLNYIYLWKRASEEFDKTKNKSLFKTAQIKIIGILSFLGAIFLFFISLFIPFLNNFENLTDFPEGMYLVLMFFSGTGHICYYIHSLFKIKGIEL